MMCSTTKRGWQFSVAAISQNIKVDSNQLNLGHPVGQTAVVQGGGWVLTSFGHTGNSQTIHNEVHLLNFIHGNPFLYIFLEN